MSRSHLLKACAKPLAVAAVAVLVAGCVSSPPRDASGVGREPWGAEYESLETKVNAAMDEMQPAAGFSLRIPPQPTAQPGENGAAYTINEIRNQLFRGGNYRLTIYCAGSGALQVSFNFNAGRSFIFHSVGTGNTVNCTEDVTVLAQDINLPVGANRLSITADPIAETSNIPKAAIAFTVERLSN